MEIPKHRYTIRALGAALTEEMVREVHSGLPESWSPHMGNRGDPTTPHVRTVGEKYAALLNNRERHFADSIGAAPKLLDKWDAWSLAHKAVVHLKNIGVLEYRWCRYFRHPLPEDPLLKPSARPCIRSAAELVARARPVDDSHVSVPQQMMRGLLSGALTR